VAIKDEPETTIAMMDHIPTIIIAKENIELMKLIEGLEILNAIWSLALDKATGPDRFSIQFLEFFGAQSK